MLNYNPFKEYSITEYTQYKEFPYIEVENVKMVKKAILGQLRDNFMFPDRILILGERGLGKTSVLFFIKDLITQSPQAEEYNIMSFSRLITNTETISPAFNKITIKKTIILVDFPDTLNTVQFKKFLEFVWFLITHKNSKNINLIFALNKSHYDLSASLSEILGKFHNFTLNRLSYTETVELINSRLKMVKGENIFDENILELVFEYTKGIPRNVICACRNLIDEYMAASNSIDFTRARKILHESYTDQIINDRVEDPNRKEIHKKIIQIIEADFSGSVKTQAELVEKIKNKIGIGRNKTMTLIRDLQKFGLIHITFGGEKNKNKIISLT